MSVELFNPPRTLLPLNDRNYNAEDTLDWVANPECERPDADETYLIANRAALLVYAVIQDDNACYSYDDFALVKAPNGEWYLLNTCGCSCHPSPSETWQVETHSPDVEAIAEFVRSGEYSGYTLPKEQEADFVKLIEAAGGKGWTPAPKEVEES